MDDQRTVTHTEIKARARQLWIEQGKPPDSAERNWLEAEHELNAAAKSRSLLDKVKQRGGSSRSIMLQEALALVHGPLALQLCDPSVAYQCLETAPCK